MKLTLEEFRRIRPVHWSLKSFGKNVYNTTVNQTETQLFWLDFMRLVFAPKFKDQEGVPNISTFDITQPVLMTDDLHLKLPTLIETAVYFAENKTPPVKFAFGISQLTVFILTILVVVLIVIAEHYVSKKIQFERMI